jgi:hypothetical protein
MKSIFEILFSIEFSGMEDENILLQQNTPLQHH